MTIASPSDIPQVASFLLVVNTKGTGALTVSDALEMHPPESLTRTEYVPAPNPVAVAVVWLAGSFH